MKTFPRLSSWHVLGVLIAMVALSAFIVGCSNTDDNPTAPANPPSQTVLFSKSHPQIQAVMAIQNRHSKRLMAEPEIVGMGTTVGDEGIPSILVLLKSERGRSSVPKSLDGTPVTVMVTGPIKAIKGKPPKPDGGDPKDRQTRPIQLGVSGGNAYDLANGYCCSGTLGALVSKGGNLYILSNSHVLCGDIASSPGDSDKASIGDPINQPGLIDVQCQDIEDDYVATLSKLSSLTGSTNVDASFAAIISGRVRTDGSILEIGTVSSTTMAASVNLRVKKSGRTSGVTRGKVTAINADVTVGYEDECNGEYFTVEYSGQIFIGGGGFSQGGDSGSLVVENVRNNPRPVGLLFAGGGGITVANPIDDVLSYLGASMVGN
jgi:hypothetical protein